MRHLKAYKIFESTIIYGQKEGFSNQDILDDVRDILLELEDIGIECRMWTNNYRGGNRKSTDKLSRIVIEINYYNGGSNIENIVKEVKSRLESYFDKYGRVRVTYQDKDSLELDINIFR